MTDHQPQSAPVKLVPAATRILISGLGIAGTTLAYWLRRYGFEPTLVERAPAPRTGGYMIDFWGVGYDVADRMGLQPALESDGYRIEEVRIVDADGKRAGGFDARVFQAATRGRFVSLPRSDLARRIYELVADDIETIFGDSITGIREEPSGVSVSFEHSAPRRFSLVIGADGLHSNVRRLTFGHSVPAERLLGYYAAAFTSSTYPHRTEGAYVTYSVPGRELARYALRDGSSAFLLIFANRESLSIVDAPRTEQKRYLRTIFGGAGWETDEILDAMDGADDLYLDAVAQARVPEWSRGRIALVGDAAYCPSLLAGQGAALAMAGAYELASALTAAPDHREAFTSFERRFKPFVEKKQRAAARVGWWFAPGSPLGIRLRNLATYALHVPAISPLVVRRAFGDQFELRPEAAVNEVHHASN